METLRAEILRLNDELQLVCAAVSALRLSPQPEPELADLLLRQLWLMEQLQIKLKAYVRGDDILEPLLEQRLFEIRLQELLSGLAIGK